MKRPPVRILLPAILAIVAIGAALWFFLLRPDEEPLTLYGNIDIREVELAFTVSGQIAELTVDEGAAVQAGQVLARLDRDSYQAELAEARAAVETEQAQLALLRAGNRDEDVAQAEASVAEQRARLRDAQADVDRLVQLRGSGATSERAYENAIGGRDAAAAQLRAATQALRKQRSGARPQEINRQEAQVERARAVADRIAVRLGDTILRAPSDGVILTRAVEKGAIVQAGSTVYTEALARPVWARVYVEAPDLGLMAPGRVVRLRTDAAPGHSYTGRIGYVSPTAEFTPKSVETPELRTELVYRARIIVLDPDSRLRQGMPVTVTLPGGEREH
jgi:HlyD family secretion protein